MEELAKKHRYAKFVRCPATEAIPNYPDRNIPTVMVYKNTNPVAHIVGIKAFGGEKMTANGVHAIPFLCDGLSSTLFCFILFGLLLFVSARCTSLCPSFIHCVIIRSPSYIRAHIYSFAQHVISLHCIISYHTTSHHRITQNIIIYHHTTSHYTSYHHHITSHHTAYHLTSSPHHTTYHHVSSPHTPHITSHHISSPHPARRGVGAGAARRTRDHDDKTTATENENTFIIFREWERKQLGWRLGWLLNTK